MQTVNATKLSRDAGMTVLVYGPSGRGKTTLATTLPGSTLVIDVEAGTEVLRAAENVEIVTVRTDMSNLRELFDELTTDTQIKSKYDNIVLDSASELEKFMLIRLAGSEENKNDGMPSLHDYGVVSFRMRDYMRKMRDLRDRGVNVYVTALEMPLELEEGVDVVRTMLYPMMGKKLAPEIVGLFDVVARLEVSQKPGHEGERWLRLDGDDVRVGKNRYTRDTWAPPDLTAMFKLLRGKAEPAAAKKTAKKTAKKEDAGNV